MPCFVQRVGHRFVGGQHELFDDLMAFGVLDDVCARHAAVLVEIDLHFRHRQFQRPALEAAAPKHHRQLVHAAEQVVHLRRQLAPPGFAIGQILVDFFVGEAALAADRGVVQIDARCESPSGVNSMNAVLV